jgi:hypothetical protein
MIVHAGPNKVKFAVPAGMVKSRSGYFKKASSKEWRNNGEKAIALEDVDATVFNLYLKGLIRNKLDDGDTHEEMDPRAEDTGNEEELAMRACILADYLLDVTTQNIVMDWLVERLTEHNMTLNDECFRIAVGEGQVGGELHAICNFHLAFNAQTDELDSIDATIPTTATCMANAFVGYKRVVEADSFKPVTWCRMKSKLRTTQKHRYHKHDDEHPSTECVVCEVE